MDKISSLSQLQELTRGHTKARLTHTNFYLLPSECKRLIGAEKLFYIDTPGTLFILEQRDGFYKLYLRFCNAMSDFHLPQVPLSCHLTYREKPDGAIIERLIPLGLHRRHTQHRLTAAKLSAKTTVHVTPATEDEALTLFSEAFSPLSSDLPCRGMFHALTAVRGDDGIPLGIMHYDDKKTLLLVAVSPDAQRKGVASSLIAEFAKSTSHLLGEYHIWVVDGNDKALALYEKMGFSPDGLKSDLYTL